MIDFLEELKRRKEQTASELQQSIASGAAADSSISEAIGALSSSVADVMKKRKAKQKEDIVAGVAKQKLEP
jgi:hypothetical protein